MGSFSLWQMLKGKVLGLMLMRDSLQTYVSAVSLITAGMAAANIGGFSEAKTVENELVYILAIFAIIGALALIDAAMIPSVPGGKLTFTSLVAVEAHRETRRVKFIVVTKLIILLAFFVATIVLIVDKETIVAKVAKNQKQLKGMSCDYESPQITLTDAAQSSFSDFFTSYSSSSASATATSATGGSSGGSSASGGATGGGGSAKDKTFYVCFNDTRLPIPTAFVTFVLGVCLVIMAQVALYTHENLTYKGMADALRARGHADFDLKWRLAEKSGALMGKLYTIAALRFTRETFAQREQFFRSDQGAHIDRRVGMALAWEHYLALRAAFCMDAPLNVNLKSVPAAADDSGAPMKRQAMPA
ncbi:hypothetical protein JKP88DRAFT_310046 [Tribonema minus]|uniref:Uncharacterized protein n=1 Tax=Tribonema minus TaxID=303371 RepID=A0A836CHG3_9STRA|nr:hypothetical protein JKP88DRAFT_310046 [Tribonema minus]